MQYVCVVVDGCEKDHAYDHTVQRYSTFISHIVDNVFDYSLLCKLYMYRMMPCACIFSLLLVFTESAELIYSRPMNFSCRSSGGIAKAVVTFHVLSPCPSTQFKFTSCNLDLDCLLRVSSHCELQLGFGAFVDCSHEKTSPGLKTHRYPGGCESLKVCWMIPTPHISMPRVLLIVALMCRTRQLFL
jgi:hypothetical protein